MQSSSADTNLDPEIVGLIAAVANAQYDLGAAAAEYEAGRSEGHSIDALRADAQSAKDALHAELGARFARHRRADEILALCKQWFEQNEATLRAAGIGGFKPLPSSVSGEKP